MANSPQATVRKDHRLGGLTTEIYFLMILEAGHLRSGISRTGFSRSFSPWLVEAAFSVSSPGVFPPVCMPRVSIFLSYQNRAACLPPHSMSVTPLNAISPHTVALRGRAATCEPGGGALFSLSGRRQSHFASSVMSAHSGALYLAKEKGPGDQLCRFLGLGLLASEL